MRRPDDRRRPARFAPLVLASLALLWGCDGGIKLPASATNASPQGLWTGMDSNGLLLTGLIDAAGHADVIRADGTQFTGTALVSGTQLTMAVDGYTQFASKFATGIPPFGTGSFRGTLNSQKTLSGTLSFMPAGGSTQGSGWTLSFNTLYDTASSLQTLSGTYGDSAQAVNEGEDPLEGGSVTISTDGQMSGQNPYNACVLNGSATIVDAHHDLYAIQYTLANCVNTLNGDFQQLNGVAFSGVADLSSATVPVELLMAVTGEDAAGDHFGIVSQLSAS